MEIRTNDELSKYLQASWGYEYEIKKIKLFLSSSGIISVNNGGGVFYNEVDLNINDTNKDTNFTFNKCEFKKDFIINNTINNSNKKIKLEFDNCTFNGDLFIADNTEENFLDYLTFRNCTFNKSFTIDSIKINNVQFFHGCKFNGFTDIIEITCSDISFNNSEINKSLSIDKSKKLGVLSIKDSRINGKIKINSKFDDFKFESNRKLGETSEYIIKFDISEENSNSIVEFKKIKDIDELVFGGKDGAEIKSILFDKVYMSETGKGLFLFYNFIVNKFSYFNTTIIPEKVVFNGVTFQSLEFKDIYLGEALFNGVEINKLYLENATLNDCIFNGVDFPKDYKLEEGNLSSKQLKDNYRQLKFVMDKNGNHTEANKFYELEMEYYMKSLKIKKGFKQLLDFQFLGEDSKNIGEILILKFGYITSDFGNNLFRIFYTIFLYIVLSFLLVWLLEKGFIKIFTDLIDYLTSDDLLQRLLIVFIVLFVLLIIDSIYKKISNKIKNIFSHSVIIVFFIILAFIIGFKYNMFHTLNILINPLSGLSKGDLEGFNSLEQFGFIIYKIIYGFLVYQLIVALKRTTKR